MAITIADTPANIDNTASFSITTTLVEDATHVNLRIRADVTVSTEIVAAVEKPKGITIFELSAVLKTLVPGISFIRDASPIYDVSNGSPLVAYTVTFTEVWETAAGVTTTGATSTSSTYKFVNAKTDGTLYFPSFVCYDSYSYFANQTLRNNACKFYTYNPVEMWIVFFTEVVNVELFYSKDSAAWDHATHMTCDGWGVIVLNRNRLMSGVTNNLRLQIGEVGGAKISEILTVYVDHTQLDKRTILEYDGLYGGKEYLAFEGGNVEQFTTQRNYYTKVNKNRGALSFFGIERQQLETRFNDINNTVYLKGLLVSDNVKKMMPLYRTPKEVTVITEDVRISDSELFFNKIEIESEY